MDLMKYYARTAVSCLVVMVLLLLPSSFFPRTPAGLTMLDKVVHAILFAIPTMLFAFDYRKAHGQLPHVPLTFLVIGAFAFITELSQLATRTRHFDLLDFMADILGILLGLAAVVVHARCTASSSKT